MLSTLFKETVRFMAKSFSILRFIFRSLIWSTFSALLVLIILAGMFVVYLESQLPDVSELNKIQLQTPLRVYSMDGLLIGEFGTKRRIPVALNDIPKPIIAAVLATEDQRYYDHTGVDPIGMFRAVKNLAETGTKSQGGSTITMQVARNFYLSPEKTYLRKIKEILLAMKIDKELSKEKVLELYLNKIFYGNRAYGIAAAAEVYYGKKLPELTLAEIATLAGIPKAPSKLNPLADREASLIRRNHVLNRLYEENVINKKQLQEALKTPETAAYHDQKVEVSAAFVAESVREDLHKQFGPSIYTRGLNVYTTIHSKLQTTANQVVRKGLLDYDRAHGYRGPELELGENDTPRSEWTKILNTLPTYHDMQPALVLESNDDTALVQLQNGKTLRLSGKELSWSRPDAQGRLQLPILKAGDIIRLRQNDNASWELAQVPQIEGAMVALNPNNGSVVALVGGFSFKHSPFNRVTQAQRQAGSALKPFLYAAGLAKGLTLSTTLNDAPIIIHDAAEGSIWRPQNVTREFYGMTRLREALIKSRNLVSIRLLQEIGVKYAVNYLTNFGFPEEKIPRDLSLALGTAQITPLELTRGYAVLANGGYLINPYMVDHITTVDGHVLFQAHPAVACTNCAMQTQPAETHLAPQTIASDISYLITNTLQDTVRRGTATKALVLKRRDIAGKTGTTNQQNDAWFAGYSLDLVATVWVGFDQPQSIGAYGADIALPIWIDFMRIALAGVPEKMPIQPPTVVSRVIDPKTGLLARPDQTQTLVELFQADHLPTETSSPSDSEGFESGSDAGTPATGTTGNEHETLEQLF